jgi:hypothetical protein
MHAHDALFVWRHHKGPRVTLQQQSQQQPSSICSLCLHGIQLYEHLSLHQSYPYVVPELCQGPRRLCWLA